MKNLLPQFSAVSSCELISKFTEDDLTRPFKLGVLDPSANAEEH